MRSAVIGFALILGLSASASAHGRPPYVERIAFDPNDPDRIVLQFSYGLVVSEDGGASWTWVCGAAYGIDAGWEDPDITITGDGSTIIGTFTTALRAAPDLCTFEQPGGSIADAEVIDLEADPHDPDVVWALTTRGGGDPELLQRTEDGGRRWVTVGEPLDALLASVALSPSDPARVYVTGLVPRTALMPRRALLYRSTDRGERFTPIEIEILEGEETPIVVGVDPTDAERLFVRMPRRTLDREPERLLVSEDGGDTFVTAHTLHQMRGFALSEDGRTVWAGSATGDGVWVARDGALAFTQVNTLHVRCLESRGETLWLCVDQLNSRFALGRSDDEGESVEELFYLDEVEDRPECPTCSATGVICPFWIDDLAIDFTRYFDAPPGMPVDASIPGECIDAGPPDSGAGGGLDAGVEPGMDGGVTTPQPAGCGCRAGGGERSGGALALVIFAALSAMRRRRA